MEDEAAAAAAVAPSSPPTKKHKRPTTQKKAKIVDPSQTIKTTLINPSSENEENVLMELKTSQSLQFKTIFDALKDLLTSVNLNFDKDGIKLIALDPGRIGMVHLQIKNLEYYYCKEPVTAGVYINYVYKLIRNLTSSDLLHWVIYKNDPTNLHILIKNNEKRTVITNTLKILDLDEEVIDIPALKFDRVISLPSSDFSRYIRETASVASKIRIMATDSTLEISAEGDIAGCRLVIEPTSGGLNWLHNEAGTVSGLFHSKYLERFSRTQIDSSVEIFLKEAYPLVIRYELNICVIRFLLSPICEDED
jgi:proliferating cell nuclear antigen